MLSTGTVGAGRWQQTPPCCSGDKSFGAWRVPRQTTCGRLAATTLEGNGQGLVLHWDGAGVASGPTHQGRAGLSRIALLPAHRGCRTVEGELRPLIHRLPLGPRDAAFLAAAVLTVDFLAAVLAADFLAFDFLAFDFLVSVPSEPVFFLSRTGSILAAPTPGANKLS